MDRSAFQHNAIPDLSKESNSLEYDFNWSIAVTTLTAQEEPSTNLVDPLLTENEHTKKRSIFYVSDMDIEQQVETKGRYKEGHH